MMFMRPVSGSAALAVLKDIIKGCGADSKTAVAAALMFAAAKNGNDAGILGAAALAI